MNAQECRTLTATCMHIAWLTVYNMFNIRSIELHTLHLNRVLVLLNYVYTLHLNRILVYTIL